MSLVSCDFTFNSDIYLKINEMYIKIVLDPHNWQINNNKMLPIVGELEDHSDVDPGRDVCLELLIFCWDFSFW